MKIVGYGKANEADILAYEQKTGCKLPEDYKQFMLEKNGGDPEALNNHVIIPGIRSEKFKVCHFRWITKPEGVKSNKYNIMEPFNIFGVYIDSNYVVPFVVIYGSVQIMMITKEGMEGIYVYDFLQTLKESSKKKWLHKVCDTFTEFLDLIVPDEN